MEDVKTLVEGYCQITGRPTFTITVDEYIKFHQLAAFHSPFKQERVVETSIPKEDSTRFSTQTEVASLKNEVEQPKKEELLLEKTTNPILLEAETSDILMKEKSHRETKKEDLQPIAKTNNSQMVLEMLKSIKG